MIDIRHAHTEHISGIDLELLAAGFAVTDENWRQDPRYARFSRLYYVMDGSGVLYSDTEKIILEPGYVYLSPCGTKCGYYGAPSVTKMFFHVCIAGENGEDSLQKVSHLMRLSRSIKEIERLKKNYFSDSFDAHLQVKGAVMATVCEFLRKAEILEEHRYSHAVARAVAYMRTHLTASLTVEEIAAETHYARSTLCAAFRREVGQTMAEYIEDLVMSEAETLLLDGDLPIGTISERLGFCDQFYFSRRFRRHFGVPPMAYRQATLSTAAAETDARRR